MAKQKQKSPAQGNKKMAPRTGAPRTSAPKATARATAPKVAAAKVINAMPFGRKNYLFLLISVGLLALGYITMAAETAEYGFGFLGLTLGPLLLMAGFIVGVFAILIKPTGESTSSDS
ncbi:MAG: DUF3098 domain-containing protein [Bacteroidota bacterium]